MGLEEARKRVMAIVSAETGKWGTRVLSMCYMRRYDPTLVQCRSLLL